MAILGCNKLFLVSTLVAILYIIPAWTATSAMLNSYYIALDYNATEVLEGSPYSPPKDQYITVSNLNIPSDEMTIEINFFWRGYNLGSGQPNQPLFFWGDINAGQPFMMISPRSNDPGTTEEIPAHPGVYLAENSTSVNKFEFEGYADNRWAHITFGLSNAPGASSYAVISTWGSGGFVDGTQINFASPIRPRDIGTKAAYFGNVPPSMRATLNVTEPFAGRIDEYRIWNKFMTFTEVKNIRQVSLVGSEANLTAYWRFDEGATGNTVVDSAGDFDGVFSGADASLIQRRLHTQEAVSPFATPPDKFLPLTRANRVTSYNTPVSLKIAVDADIDAQTYTVNIRNFPPHSLLCTGVGCSGQGQASTPGPSSREFSLTTTPTRGSCGLTENGVIYVREGSSPGTTTNDFTFSVTVTPLIADFSSAQRQVVPTTGGTSPLTFRATSLGLTGGLANNEVLRIRLTNGAILPCTGITIQGSPEAVRCSVGPGVGTGNLEGTLCNNPVNVVNIFGYERPTVETVSGLNVSQVYIKGTNFGPDRIFDQSYDNITLVDGDLEIACIVEEVVNHTTIYCNTDMALDTKNYVLRLTIGGQTLEQEFEFQICNPPCQNKGKCVGINQCDCLFTGYEGPTCGIELVCQPDCKDGNGVCVRSTEDGKLRCSCFDEWRGVDCSRLGEPGEKNNVPLIAGIVGGGGGVILILSIVVVILAVRKARQPKRGGVNFIPLEKKDFTKIIWGEQLNQNPEKTSGNTKQLEELLVEDNLELAATISHITQITEADKIAKAMVVIFQENDKVLHLLQAFIGEEVNTTESAGTLFRSNSMVSKMFKFYSRLIGLPYLYETIGPEINELIEEELGLEVDPEKMEEGTDLDEMRWTLMAQSQKILKSILNSVDKCPPQFRVLFSHIKKCVAERFPGNVNTTIGGFIFLRFFCPAVSSPEAYGIVEEPPSASSRRLLILITKVLQNLSNDVEFGSKEPYMTKMNDFIHSNRSKLEQYYEKLVKPSSKPPVVIETPKHMKAISLAILSNHIRDNISKVEDPALKSKLEAIV